MSEITISLDYEEGPESIGYLPGCIHMPVCYFLRMEGDGSTLTTYSPHAIMKSVLSIMNSNPTSRCVVKFGENVRAETRSSIESILEGVNGSKKPVQEN